MVLGKTPLLGIPVELRRMIYGYLFASSPIRPYLELGYGENCNRQAPNVLLVNRQIRAEASDVFFNEGRFVIEISERRMAFLSSLTNAQNYTFFEAPKNIRKIKHVSIELYLDVKNPGDELASPHRQTSWIHDNMRNICQALFANSILKTLEVSCWYYNPVPNRLSCSWGAQLDTAIPLFFQYPIAFEEFAGPLSWIRIHGEVDFKEIRDFGAANDTLSRLKNAVQTGTIATGPSELDMMWLQLKQELSDYQLEKMSLCDRVPLWFCLMAVNEGRQELFEMYKPMAVAAVMRCCQPDE